MLTPGLGTRNQMRTLGMINVRAWSGAWPLRARTLGERMNPFQGLSMPLNPEGTLRQRCEPAHTRGP